MFVFVFVFVSISMCITINAHLALLPHCVELAEQPLAAVVLVFEDHVVLPHLNLKVVHQLTQYLQFFYKQNLKIVRCTSA